MLSADDVTPRPKVVSVTSSSLESRDQDKESGSLRDERKGSSASLGRCWGLVRGSVTSLQGSAEWKGRRESIVESLEKKCREKVRCRLRSKLLINQSTNNTTTRRSSLSAAAELPVIVRPPAASSALPHRPTSRPSVTGRHFDWTIAQQPFTQSAGVLQVRLHQCHHLQPQFQYSEVTLSDDDRITTALCDVNPRTNDRSTNDVSVRRSSSSVCQLQVYEPGRRCARSSSALSITRHTTQAGAQTQRNEHMKRTAFYDVNRSSTDASTDSSCSEESEEVTGLLSRSDASPLRSQCQDTNACCTSWSTGAVVEHTESAKPVRDGQAECRVCRPPVTVCFDNAARDTTPPPPQNTNADESQTSRDLESKYAALTSSGLTTTNIESEDVSQNETLRLVDNEAPLSWSDDRSNSTNNDDVTQLVSSSSDFNPVEELRSSGEPSQPATAKDCSTTSGVGGQRYRTTMSLSLANPPTVDLTMLTSTTSQSPKKLVCYSATLQQSFGTGHKQVASVSNNKDPALASSSSSLPRTTQRAATESYSPGDHREINEGQSATRSQLLELTVDDDTMITPANSDDDDYDDVMLGDEKWSTDTGTCSSDDEDDVNHVFHVTFPHPPPFDHTTPATAGGPSVERSWQTLRTNSRRTAVVPHKATSASCASTTRPQVETPTVQRANSPSANETTQVTDQFCVSSE